MISFIMPHEGRDRMLIETIVSIYEQQVFSAAIAECEVIVVSRDNTISSTLASALLRRSIKIPLQVINVSHDKSISTARNKGAAIASGQFLAFVDSDVRLSPNWASTMLELIEQPRVVLASAVQVPDVDRKTNDVIRSAMSESKVGEVVEALPGANLFLRREVFENSEKFPEHLQTCEDSVFTNSLCAKGKLVLTSRAGFVHLGEDLTLASLFRKEIWRGKSNLDSIQGRAVSWDELPSLILPLFILGCIALFLVLIILGYLVPALYILLLAVFPGFIYSVALKWRTRVNLGFPKIAMFYQVYFVARGTGMTQRMFERLGSRSVQLTDATS